MFKPMSCIEIGDVRIYTPDNHIMVQGREKDNEGNEITVIRFQYQEPHRAKFRYTDPDGTVYESD